MAAVLITRMDHTARMLRQSAARCRDSAAARRMLALALVLDGAPRGDAARACGMARQTLRDWGHRYNAEGLEGLFDHRGGSGPARRLPPAQEAWVAAQVRHGPELSRHGVVRWRRIDLARAIEAEFGVILAERTAGTLLRRLGFRRMPVRPRHPGQNAEAQQTHKKLRRTCCRRRPGACAR
jgi:transposase